MSAPGRYWDLQLCYEKSISLKDWDDPDYFEPRQKAQLLAYAYIASMVSTIEGHYEAQESAVRDAKKN